MRITCAFISDDALLTKAIEREKIDNLKPFESVKNFLGHVSLVRSKIDQEQAIALQANAQKTFCEADNPSSIYFRDKIDERIRNQFSLVLAHPNASKDYLGISALIDPPSTQIAWTQMGQDKTFINGTTYSGRPKSNVFEWKSRLLYVGLFQVFGNAYLAPQLRKTTFEITWTSRIKDSTIADPVVQDPIALVDTQFSITTAEEAKTYGFEMPIQQSNVWGGFSLANISDALQGLSSASVTAAAAKKDLANK